MVKTIILIFIIFIILIISITIFLYFKYKHCPSMNKELYINSSIKENYDTLGFVIIPKVFTKEEIDECRKEIQDYSNENHTSIVNFIGRNILPKTSKLKDSNKLHLVLREIFNGDNYRFCGHNDIGFNRFVNWHKDKLNTPYDKYEKLDVFNKNQNICKVAIYLQEHSNNNDALHIIPGSQYTREIKTNNCRTLQPSVGDVVVFDQRLTHRGRSIFDIFKFGNSIPRILVSFGFGLNNEYTDQFELGTKMRQQNQLSSGNFSGTKIK